MVLANEVLISEESKESFLNALIRVAKSDRIIKESEEEFFESLALGLNLTEDKKKIVKENWAKNDLKVEFSSNTVYGKVKLPKIAK